MNQTYIGVKIILGQPMTRGDYNTYRGWETPERENAEDDGYLVEYPDSAPNHPDHLGYISWSPKSVFDKSHVPVGNTEGLEPFVIRLLGERAELNDRLAKLNTFLRQDVVPVDDNSLQLLHVQKQAMEDLLGVLDRRLDTVDIGVNIEGEARIEVSLSNKTLSNAIGLALDTLSGTLGEAYTGTVADLTDGKILDANGQEVENTSVEIGKVSRGFTISGHIDENLYEVLVDCESGRVAVVSSFESGYVLSINAKLGTRNRLPTVA